MTERERHEAVLALVDWFENQRISMFDALAILGLVLIHIHAVADEPEEVG